MLDKRRIPHRAAMAGDRLEVGRGNVLDVLAPTDWTLRALAGDQNNNSLALSVRHGARRVLLGADIQEVGATVLLHAGLDLRSNVLVVPHHGRAMPNSGQFAAAVRPAIAICSVRGDHLPPATIAVYEAAGARVLATCWDGAVTVTIREGGLGVKGWKGRAAANRGLSNRESP